MSLHRPHASLVVVARSSAAPQWGHAVLVAACEEALQRVGSRPRGVERVTGSDDSALAIKVGRGAGLRRLARAFGRHTSRSAHAFALGEALLARGVATPRPVAVLELRRWGRCALVDVLVTEWTDAETLDVALRKPGDAGPAALRAAATGIARMHATRVTHRDLKASNLLWETTDGDTRVVVTDLDGARAHTGPPTIRRRARDLARLVLSAEVAGVDPAHLLGEYERCVDASPAESRRLRGLIAARTARWRATSARELI